MTGYDTIIFIFLWTWVVYLWSRTDSLSDEIKKLQRELKSYSIKYK